MDTKELRIGNFLYYDMPLYEGDAPKVVKIIRLSKDCIIDETNKNTVVGNPENYKPIQLTEEWLIKFGFVLTPKDKVRSGVAMEYKKKGFKVEISNSGNLYCKKQKGLLFESVHQIQNLFFALTGEELKIN